MRDLASPAFQPLPETEGASYPFWSPDSQHVAFLAEGKLKRIRAEGGRPTTICDGGFRTGSWSHNDVILFAPARSSALARVSAAGGEPTPATTLDQDDGEVQHSYPIFLPDSNHFLYFGVGSKTAGAIDPRGVYLGSLDGGTPAKLLLPGVAHAKYAGGYLLFVRGGTLMAQPFDLTRNELQGQAIPLVERVNVPTAGATGVTGAFSVSDNGVIVYQAGVITQSQPTWFDRAGKQVGTLGAPGDYSDVALSPDGANLAVSVMDQTLSTRDLWLYDVNGGRGQRFTFGSGDDFAPTWSPDGQRLLFSSSRKGAVDLWVKDVGGVGDEQPLKGDMLGLGKFATDWSRDGRFIMYIGGARVINRSDLWIVPIGAQQAARALLESAFVETHGRFAPDSKWFVYTSLESQQSEVYVDRFPGRGAKTRVSTAGGGWARWGKDGSEILYLSPDNRLMAAPVKVMNDRLDIGAPRALFVIRPRPPVRLDAYPYDVSADGRRFVVNTLVEETASTGITLLVHWTAALRMN